MVVRATGRNSLAPALAKKGMSRKMLSQSQRQSRGRASVGASPWLSHLQQRVPGQQSCWEKQSPHPSLTSANHWAETSQHRHHWHWGAEEDQVLNLYPFAPSVIELAPQHKRWNFSYYTWLIAVKLEKLNCDNDLQMEINLFLGHFHCETWFKGTRGKGD